MKPTPHHTAELVHYLSRQDWRDLGRKLNQAVKRNRISAARDGFPGGPGRGSGIPDPTGAAATARDPRDPVDEHTRAAAKHLEEAVVHVQNLAKRLDLLEHLASDRDLNPEPGCAVCARAEHWSPVHRSSDVGGRLPQPRPLCRWCHDFVRSMGRLPTSDEAQAHHEGRRVRLKVS